MTGAAQRTDFSRVYPYGTKHSPEMISDLARRAYGYRIEVLRMVYARGSGHALALPIRSRRADHIRSCSTSTG